MTRLTCLLLAISISTALHAQYAHRGPNSHLNLKTNSGPTDSPKIIEDLQYFVVKALPGRNVSIRWKTSSAKYNQYEIERQIAGADRFENVKTLHGQSTDGVYEYDDILPIDADGATYRIKQTDLSGSTKYSFPNHVFAVADTQPLVYPNPSSSIINIAGLVSESEIHLYDSLGRLIAQADSKEPDAQLSVEHLVPGNYSLSIINRESTLNRKIVIQ